MHQVAEAGVASHWIYKSLEDSTKEVQLKTHQWLQSLLDADLHRPVVLATSKANSPKRRIAGWVRRA